MLHMSLPFPYKIIFISRGISFTVIQNWGLTLKIKDAFRTFKIT